MKRTVLGPLGIGILLVVGLLGWGAGHPEPAASDNPCSLRTLQGLYVYHCSGVQFVNGQPVPFAFAGRDQYHGDGTLSDLPRDGLISLREAIIAANNTLDVDIKDNTVADNGDLGIRVVAGQDNSAHNHVEALIRGNTVERHQFVDIFTIAGEGAIDFPTGTSNDNVLEVKIERNRVGSQTATGIYVSGAEGSRDGRREGVADHNQTTAVVKDNTVGSTVRGIELYAGDSGLAIANTTEVQVAHNTVCRNTGDDIHTEGGAPGGIVLGEVFAPNLGSGNVLTGEISKNTATTVMVADGTPGNTADVTQSKNVPCP